MNNHTYLAKILATCFSMDTYFLKNFRVYTTVTYERESQ